jgi:hypothetical protein
MDIVLKGNIDPLKKDLAEAVKITSDASEKFAQAAAKASAKAAGGTDAILASGKNLQQTYRALAKEAFQAGANQGVFSEKALQAARAAGEVKKELDDARIAINILADDTPLFTSMGNALQGVAGAASIATGALALMGGESEDVQKTIMKIQASLAILQGVQSLNKLNDSFAALKVVVMTSVIPSITALDMVTKATLIGAIAAAAVAIYGLVQDMNEASDSAERLAASEKAIADSTDAMSAAVKKARDANMATLSLEVQAMKDGAEKEIELSKLKALQASIEAKERFKASEQSINDSRRYAREVVAIEEISKNEIAEINNKYSNEATKKAQDDAKKAKDISQKQFDERIKHNRLYFEATEKYTDSILALKEKERQAGMQIGPMDMDVTMPKPVQIPVKLVIEKAASTQAFENLKVEIQRFKDFAVNAFMQLGMQAAYALGQSLVAGDSWGADMKSLLANLMSTTAQALMALGTAMLPVNPGWGAVVIGGGIALQVAAGALSASGGGGGGTSTSSPSMAASPSFSNPSFNGGGDMSTRLYGKDLMIIYQRQSNFKGR